MKCKKCGTVLAEHNYEKCLCDSCQKRKVSFKFLGWSYIIEEISALLICIFAIAIFHDISWGKAVLLCIGLIFCVIGVIKGFLLLIQKN